MRFIHDQEEGSFDPRRMLEDLGEEPFLAPSGLFSKLGDDGLQQATGTQVGQVTIDRLVAIPRQFVQEAFQDRRFADPRGPGDQSQRCVFEQK